jgi:hypothetical protein
MKTENSLLTAENRMAARSAATALYNACPNYGALENLAHALAQAAVDIGEADPVAHEILRRISSRLFDLHDNYVK